tara:strand:- start:123 stop:425 length:303 start_codon:yes stop_codon:yes gene_type:complete
MEYFLYATLNFLCFIVPICLADKSIFRRFRGSRIGKYLFIASMSSALLSALAFFFEVPIVVFRNALNAQDSAFLGLQATIMFLFLSGVFFLISWIKVKSK